MTLYKHRWSTIEYHKCLKTGCKIEEAQLKTSDRIMTLFGLLGVVATRLLQLKTLSRANPDDLAEKYVDKDSILVLQSIYNLKTPWTVKEYWRRVAMLIGFMSRKSDGSEAQHVFKKFTWRLWVTTRLLRGRVRDKFRPIGAPATNF